MKDLQPSEAGIIRKRVQQIANNLLAVAGGIVSLVTLVVWLTSAGFRYWVKDNSYWVFGGFATAVVTILVLLNFMQGTNARYAEVRRLLRADALQRADRDRRAMGMFLSRIPPESAFILWLKKGFNPSSIPLERLEALDEMGQYLSSDPARFEDPLAVAGYRALTTATGAFSQKLLRWTSFEAGNAQRIIPIEWRPGAKYDHAVAEIQAARNDMVDSYDAFLITCRERGIEPG